MEIQKGMYGLLQVGRIAHELLVKCMGKHGYHPCRYIPRLWRHETRPTIFSLIVDDFGIKVIGDEHASFSI